MYLYARYYPKPPRKYQNISNETNHPPTLQNTKAKYDKTFAGHFTKDVEVYFHYQNLPEEELITICSQSSLPVKNHTTDTIKNATSKNLSNFSTSPGCFLPSKTGTSDPLYPHNPLYPWDNKNIHAEGNSDPESDLSTNEPNKKINSKKQHKIIWPTFITFKFKDSAIKNNVVLPSKGTNPPLCLPNLPEKVSPVLGTPSKSLSKTHSNASEKCL